MSAWGLWNKGMATQGLWNKGMATQELWNKDMATQGLGKVGIHMDTRPRTRDHWTRDKWTRALGPMDPRAQETVDHRP